jgi:hypothetical protein
LGLRESSFGETARGLCPGGFGPLGFITRGQDMSVQIAVALLLFCFSCLVASQLWGR